MGANNQNDVSQSPSSSNSKYKGKGNRMLIGVIFLLIGVSLILKAIFHIDLPLFRIGAGLFLIYLGIKVMVGNHCRSRHCNFGSENTAIFTERDFTAHGNDSENVSYQTLFGRAVLDLTKLAPVTRRVELNTVFGETVVRLDPKQNVRVFAHAVFGNAMMPDGNSVSFGKMSYQSPASEAKGSFTINANVVFGNLVFQSAQISSDASSKN